jgi:hypothetical protein
MSGRLTGYCVCVVLQGIPGQYCAVRFPEKCCNDRNDDCTVNILGDHKCYCDMFCHRETEEMHGDCCPDFEEVCLGVVKKGRESERTEYKRLQLIAACEGSDGQMHSIGERVMLNCKTCTCGSNGWERCDPDSICLIQAELLKTNRDGRYSCVTVVIDLFSTALDAQVASVELFHVLGPYIGRRYEVPSGHTISGRDRTEHARHTRTRGEWLK